MQRLGVPMIIRLAERRPKPSAELRKGEETRSPKDQGLGSQRRSGRRPDASAQAREPVRQAPLGIPPTIDSDNGASSQRSAPLPLLRLASCLRPLNWRFQLAVKLANGLELPRHWSDAGAGQMATLLLAWKRAVNDDDRLRVAERTPIDLRPGSYPKLTGLLPLVWPSNRCYSPEQPRSKSQPSPA